MTKDDTKLVINQLIKKYETAKASQLISKYTEEETKKDLILPLFKALGWNVDEKSEVTAEEYQSSGRVDYGFYINSRLKFYLEAKTLGANLHKEEFANQAIKYSWNKGATWAILTNFESIKVFNAQDIDRSLADKLFFEIPYTQYLERFDQLCLLSKNSFEENLLDKEAEKVGKKFQKIAVSTLLYRDLDECRRILTHDLAQWNPQVHKDLLDEGIQKLLDRLIFLRVAEDRNIEPPTLIPLIREWKSSGRKKHLYESMIQKFRDLDPIYDSNLFSEHPFEKWEEYSNATEKVINILYGKKGYYEYDFKVMPADVLGTVYENYLGYRLEKSKKGLSVGKDAKKRKDHGIYYTPSYIVEYIVKNTLKPILDKCKSISDLKKIKVLDPACGSGSFLIQALEVIYNKYLEFGNNGGVFTKLDILINNIYGVDLDTQAVEIARLNLLINALDQRMTLPGLDKNIKNGNSLISGTDEELKRYFGSNFKDKEPFNWEEEFPDVFKQGGFDVVIGNPPYIDSVNMTKNMEQERRFINEHYSSAKGNWDIFCIFIEKAMNLCKDGGYHSFILPNKLISANYAKGARQVLDRNRINKIRDYSMVKVFDVAVYPIVYIVQKNKPKGVIHIEKVIDEKEQQSVKSYNLDHSKLHDGVWQLNNNTGNNQILNFKIKSKTMEYLAEIATVLGAATVNEAYILKDLIKNDGQKYRMINSGTIDRYKSMWGFRPMRYLGKSFIKPTVSDHTLGYLAKKRHSQVLSSKIIMACMTLRPECVLDKNGIYLAAKSTTIVMDSKYDLRLILAILNSKLMSVYLKNKYIGNVLQGGYLRLGPPEIRNVPIPVSKLKDKKEQKHTITLVNKITQQIKLLQETTEKSEKWRSIKLEIQKTDQKIDNEIYKLYDLTKKQIVHVEKEVTTK